MTGTGDEMGTEQIERRIELAAGQPVLLRADNVQGRTAVLTADRDDVLVTATKSGRPGSVFDQARLVIDIDERDGYRVIKVRPDIPASSPFDGEGFDVDLGRDIARDIVKGLFGRRGSDHGAAGGESAPQRRGRAGYDITVELPRALPDGSEVQVRTASGDIECAGLRGRVEIASASGDVQLREVSGDLTVQTASGDLVLDGFTGALTTRSASGDIRVDRANVTRWLVNLASGDVEFTGDLAPGEEHRVQTVSGDIRLRLDEATGTEIEFKTVSGSGISGGTVRREGKRHFRTGPDGGPRARVAVKSVSGDLEVTTRSRAAAPSGSGWATPAPAATRPAHASPPAPPSFPSPSAPPSPPAPANAAEPPEPPAGVGEPWVVVTAKDRAPGNFEDQGSPDRDDASVGDATVIPLGNPDLIHVTDAPPTTRLTTGTGGDRDTEAERMAILASLERGEIDVDDAMGRLDALQGERP